ncbi:uncharacterized protein LOC104449796 [Eucalyptus grandis]|uniref:uncharacterized protein LOC104449796 n=1 Tax=Eucalyptus grandis TaxID=71139 RepID=UPI00192EAACD|nr:uncharacterized protein LOC104449796 [Eucalyptus grandis]
MHMYGTVMKDKGQLPYYVLVTKLFRNFQNEFPVSLCSRTVAPIVIGLKMISKMRLKDLNKAIERLKKEFSSKTKEDFAGRKRKGKEVVKEPVKKRRSLILQDEEDDDDLTIFVIALKNLRDFHTKKVQSLYTQVQTLNQQVFETVTENDQTIRILKIVQTQVENAHCQRLKVEEAVQPTCQTNHVECPPKERHLGKIAFATSAVRPRADVAYCIQALSRRLTKTHNWTVALKTLIVIHRLLREGDPTFREELLAFSQRGRILQLSNLKDDSSPIGKTLSSTGKKGHDGEEPWEEEDASISEQQPEQQLEESFEQSDAHFKGNMGKGRAEAESGEEDVEEANTIRIIGEIIRGLFFEQSHQ